MEERPILVLGASGFLGPHLVAAARDAGARVAAASRSPERAPVVASRAAHELHRWDALRDGATEALLDRVGPRAIVLAAALSRAEACERDPEQARALNEELPGRVAGLARARGVRLVHLSTDLVFGARPPAHERYSETDEPSPMHAYGRSKAAGEARVLAADARGLVIRLPLLYGDSFGRGLGATDQVLAALEHDGRPVLFTDEWRTPLEAGDAARAVIELVSADANGILHVAGPVRLSRHELGLELLHARGIAPDRVRAGSRAAAALSAPWPGDVSLDSSRARMLLGTPLRAPRAALAVR